MCGLSLLLLPEVSPTYVKDIFKGLAPLLLFGVYWKFSTYNLEVLYLQSRSSLLTI